MKLGMEVWQTSYLRRLRLGEEKRQKDRKKEEETTGQPQERLDKHWKEYCFTLDPEDFIRR